MHVQCGVLTLRMLCLQQRPPMHCCPEHETGSLCQPLSESQLGTLVSESIHPSVHHGRRVTLLSESTARWTSDKGLLGRIHHAGGMSYLCVHQARAATHTTKAATMLETTTTTKQ